MRMFTLCLLVLVGGFMALILGAPAYADAAGVGITATDGGGALALLPDGAIPDTRFGWLYFICTAASLLANILPVKPGGVGQLVAKTVAVLAANFRPIALKPRDQNIGDP